MTKSQKRLSMILMAFMICLWQASGYAVDAQKNLERVTHEKWSVRAPWRFLLGLMNGGLGWTQIVLEPIQSVSSQGQNILQGAFDGVARAGYYTAVGIWDLGTFWVPGKLGRDIAIRDCVMKTFKFYAPPAG